MTLFPYTTLFRSQNRMKQQADNNRSERQLSVGDWVYLKLQPYRQITVAGFRNQKLSPKYYGPYEVLKKIGTVAYHLNLPAGSAIHPVFHVSQLKKRIGDTQAASPNLPIIGPNGALQTIPVALLARRMISDAMLPHLKFLFNGLISPLTMQLGKTMIL